MLKLLFHNASLAILSCVLFISSAPSFAASTSLVFTGNIIDITVDNGSAAYSGTLTGDSFSGGFSYGLTEADASSVFTDVTYSYWSFDGGDFGGNITNGSTLTTSSFSEITISNNETLDPETAALINLLTGSTVSTGTPVDGWIASTFSDAANTGFGIMLFSLDTNLYTSLDYQSGPPGIADVDLAAFFIQELDASYNVSFEAWGTLNTVSQVPVPAAFWLFVSGIFGLMAMGRNRRPK